MNNIPTIVPKTIRPAESKPRQTVRSRNRPTIKSVVSKPKKRKLNYDEKVSEMTSNSHQVPEDEVLVDKENCSNCVGQRARQEDEMKAFQKEREQHEKEIHRLNNKLNDLKKYHESQVKELEDKINNLNIDNLKKSFNVERFKEDEKLFDFYAGIPDYETFKAIFNSFGPVVENLVYFDSNKNAERLNHFFGFESAKMWLT